MRNSLTLLVALVVAAVLLVYMFLFVLPFDEVAVVETFGHAPAPSEDGGNAVKTDPGLYFKWPWPVQQVNSYSTKLRLLEGPRTELLTRDGRSIIPQCYVLWRVRDPHKYFTRATTEEEAQIQLRGILQSAQRIISNYSYDQLVNSDPSKLAYDKINDEASAEFTKLVTAEDYGIEVISFGIRRIALPEKVTETVFESMKAAREAQAQSILSEGRAQADKIKAEADNARARIVAFVETRSNQIRSEGERKAAQYYEAFQKDPQLAELAILLEKMASFEEALKGSATIALPARFLGFENLFPNWNQQFTGKGGASSDANDNTVPDMGGGR